MVGLTLLAEARAAGLDVQAGHDGKLIIRGPRSAEAIARRLLARKADVLAVLRPARDLTGGSASRERAAGKPVCRCGSTVWRDVPIHGGRSVRRDCARCRRFIDFVRWYGKPSDN